MRSADRARDRCCNNDHNENSDHPRTDSRWPILEEDELLEDIERERDADAESRRPYRICPKIPLRCDADLSERIEDELHGETTRAERYLHASLTRLLEAKHKI